MSEQGADTSVAVWGCWGGGVLGSQGQEWEWLDSGSWQPCRVPVEVTGPLRCTAVPEAHRAQGRGVVGGGGRGSPGS